MEHERLHCQKAKHFYFGERSAAEPSIRNAWDDSLDELTQGELVWFSETELGRYEQAMLTKFAAEAKVSIKTEAETKALENHVWFLKQRIVELGYIMHFEKCSKRTIWPSAGLLKMMAFTRANMKLEDLCFPFPYFYIVMKDLDIKYPFMGDECVGKVEGVYVGWNTVTHPNSVVDLRDSFGADADPAQYRILNIGLVATDPRKNQTGYWLQHHQKALHLKADISGEDIIEYNLEAQRDFCKDSGMPQIEIANQAYLLTRIYPLVFNLLMYMSCPGSKDDKSIYTPPLIRQLRRAKTPIEEARIKAEIEWKGPVEIIVIGKKVTLPAVEEDIPILSEEQSAGAKCTHWRRGHWHNYWVGAYGSLERHLEPRLIEAVLVNPGKSAIAVQGNYVVKESEQEKHTSIGGV